MPHVDDLMGSSRAVVLEGDCREILPTITGQVDHVVTDPPYDAKTHSNARTLAGGTDRFGPGRKTSSAVDIDFDPLDVAQNVPLLLAAARQWVICFCSLEMLGSYMDAAGDSWVRAGVWDRPDGTPQLTGDRPGQAAEGIAVMHAPGRKTWRAGGKRGMWRCGVERDQRSGHPTQKPITLMLELLEDFTSPNDLILDPFSGSATTAIAALRLGRRCLCIERDPRYAQLSRDRIQAELSSSTLSAHRAGQLPLLR